MQLCGTARFVWNKALSICNEKKQAGERLPTAFTMIKWLPLWKKDPETEFLSLGNAVTLQQKLSDLGSAWKRHYDDLAKLKAGKIRELQFGAPKFKKRNDDRDNSFRIMQFSRYCQIEGRRVKLPSKLGWVRFRKSRQIEGEIKNCTITRKSGHWFISFQTEQVLSEPVHSSGKAVGHDMGIAKFVTLSSGEQFKPLNAFRQYETKLARAQRKLARKTKFSANWQKQKKRINQIHSKIAACRSDFLHKTSTHISQNHAMTVIEDLKVSNMSKSAKGNAEQHGNNVKAKSGLNKSILDQGWYEFRRQLEYKQQWQGGDVVAVKPQYTSQRCSACGHAHKENRKSQAGFNCVLCGHAENADVNAAKNILASGHGVLVGGA